MTSLSNIRKPSELTQEIDVLGSRVSASLSELTNALVKVCRLFNEGWIAYQDDGWDNEEFRTFVLSIHAAGIGPDPKNSLLRMNAEGCYEIQSTWKYMLAIAKSEMFLDDEILAACRIGNITCLYEISSLWSECQRKKNSSTPDRALGKTRMLEFLAKNQDPTRAQIVSYKNELKKKNASDPKTARPTMPRDSLGIATIEELKTRGETFDTILVTPNEDQWDEIERLADFELGEEYGFEDIRKDGSSINISTSGKRTALAIKLASVMGVSNPEVMILTDEPITSRAIPLDQATIIVSNRKLKVPSRIGKKDTSELTLEIIRSEGSNLHLFADKEQENWTVVK